MPRNVRNFWLDLDVDGRSRIETGPRSKDGGFRLTILIRDAGGISTKRVTIGGSIDSLIGRLEVWAQADGKTYVLAKGKR